MRLIIVFHVGHDKHCMDGHTDLAINAHCWSSSSNQYLHRVDDMPSFCNVTFGLLRQYLFPRNSSCKLAHDKLLSMARNFGCTAQCCCWSSSTWIASHLLLIWSVFIYQPSYHMWHGVRRDQRNYINYYVRKPWNTGFSNFPKMNPRSYSSQMKQTWSNELLQKWKLLDVNNKDSSGDKKKRHQSGSVPFNWSSVRHQRTYTSIGVTELVYRKLKER